MRLTKVQYLMKMNHMNQQSKHKQLVKKKMKDYGGVMHEPFTRIKKELLKEVKALQPGDRVLVIGNSQCPQLCQKKDEKALMEFFQKHVYLPLPDYASMRLLWPGLVSRHHGALDVDFDLSTLAQLSEGYSAGTLNVVCRTLLSERRVAKLERKPLAVRVGTHTSFCLQQPLRNERCSPTSL